MASRLREFSVEQRELTWKLWRSGASVSEIGRQVGESLPRTRRFLRVAGGFPPVVQQRRTGHLTAGEREEISRGLAAGMSARTIASQIGRPSSTVSREIARNGGHGTYRAVEADSAAYARARRPKQGKLATRLELRELVLAKLTDDWSPQQIAQWLRMLHPDDPDMWISHETIYRDLYTPSRKVFDDTMFHHLRSDRPIRQPRGKKSTHGAGRIRNMVRIHERPAEADGREVLGHLEGDLVYGCRPSAVATLVDRASRYTIVVALPDGYKADAVASALIAQLSKLPAQMRRTLTWDRGREMAAHASITAALDLPVYFCDPHHPWQRGTNENTNRLLRQYLHKNADLRVYSQDELDRIADKLNHRPRRVLGWATPAEMIHAGAPLDAAM
ncbi:MAG: IS30 family transposase [Nocardiaceae bacterium]|nr:IS30 family transposase [Nocardiaceae bacterium]